MQESRKWLARKQEVVCLKLVGRQEGVHWKAGSGKLEIRNWLTKKQEVVNWKAGSGLLKVNWKAGSG